MAVTSVTSLGGNRPSDIIEAGKLKKSRTLWRPRKLRLKEEMTSFKEGLKKLVNRPMSL
jgi:hypothetical protein